MTLLQRLKLVRHALLSNPNATKLGAYNNNQWIGGGNSYQGLTSRNRDISDSESGYATAYTAIWYIRAAIDLYAQMSQDVPSEIIKNTTGDPLDDEVIATSKDIKPRHQWYVVETNHRVSYGVNIISAMVYQLMLYDMLFVEKTKNEFGYNAGAKVLNTLGMAINRNYDKDLSDSPIHSFQYTWQGGISKTFQTDEIAYEHGFNPYDEIEGASIIQSVIDQLNIDRNLNRFLRAFFINDARPSLVGSPDRDYVKMAGGIGGLSDEQVASLRKILSDNHQGVENSFRPLITNIPIDFQVLDPPQIQQFTEAQNNLQKQIFAAFRVNPALVGFAEDTSYKDDIPQISAYFINSALKPVLSQVEAVINIHLLPFLTGSLDFRFQFDYESYQLVTEQDVIKQELDEKRLNSGTLSMNDFAERNGGERVDALENMYIIDGTPIPMDEIKNLWKYKFLIAPSVYNSQLITDQPLPQPANPDEVVPTTQGGDPVSDAQDIVVADDIDESKHHEPSTSFDEYAKQFYQPLPSKDDVIKELTAWRKFVSSGKYMKRAFNPEATRGDIADELQLAIEDLSKGESHDKSTITKWIDAIVKGLKTAQSTRLDYEGQVEDLIEQARSSDIDKRKFRRDMKFAIRGFGELHYADGLVEGGVLSPPTEDELAEIGALARLWNNDVNKLSDVLYDGGITDTEATRKPGMWYNRSLAPFFDAGLMSADKNGMYEYVIGNREEHCSTCLKANGQIHRLKTYFATGVYPQSPSLECGGWECGCNLVRTNSSARGKLPTV